MRENKKIDIGGKLSEMREVCDFRRGKFEE
jgi:hypothetical protein